MAADSFYRGCRSSEHFIKVSETNFKVSPTAFFPDERFLSDKDTYDTSICWKDDDNALSFFYRNDKKKNEGNNIKHGISEIDSIKAMKNIVALHVQDIVTLNHFSDPGDSENVYHGNVSFDKYFRSKLEERFPDLKKKGRLRLVCDRIAMAEKDFYTPHDLQCMFPEE